MNNTDMIFELLKDMQRDLKEIHEEQIKQGFDIKENKENLKEHMARTELLENRVESLEEKDIGRKYVAKWISGFIGVLTSVVGLLYSFLKMKGKL
jgi:hypothetical protein